MDDHESIFDTLDIKSLEGILKNLEKMQDELNNKYLDYLFKYDACTDSIIVFKKYINNKKNKENEKENSDGQRIR